MRGVFKKWWLHRDLKIGLVANLLHIVHPSIELCHVLKTLAKN